MIQHFTNPVTVQKIKDNYKKQSFITPEQQQKKNELDLRLSQIDQEIENLMQAISPGNPTLLKYANLHITELDEQRQAIFTQLQELDAEEHQQDHLQAAYQFVYSYLDYFEEKIRSADFDEMKTICHTLIAQITLNRKEDGATEIIYTI